MQFEEKRMRDLFASFIDYTYVRKLTYYIDFVYIYDFIESSVYISK